MQEPMGEMGIAVRGSHHPDPDKGFGKAGRCGLPSAERWDGDAAGRVHAVYWYHHQKKRILSKGLGRIILAVVSEHLPKNHRVKVCKC